MSPKHGSVEGESVLVVGAGDGTWPEYLGKAWVFGVQFDVCEGAFWGFPIMVEIEVLPTVK